MFYNLGRMIGPKVRKGKWIWHSLTSTSAQALQTEYEVGRDLAREIREKVGLDPEPAAGELLQEIGPRLTRRVANKQRKFNFEAIRGEQPNAMALPGGFIFVNRLLLDVCERNPDEVAFILAHEMAHVIKGHAMDRIVSNMALATASRAAPVRGVMGGVIRNVGVQFLENAYSQSRELMADELGVRLMTAGKYNPRASKHLLTRLAELKRSSEEFSLPSYFSTHPPFNERIRNINPLLPK